MNGVSMAPPAPWANTYTCSAASGPSVRNIAAQLTISCMRLHYFFTAVLLAVTAAAAAKMIAPPTIPHPMAMYLQTLSNDGKDKVTFRASAIGTHFFLEEPGGVTVYVYEESVGYRKEVFLKGSTLAKAMKKYK